MCVVGVEGREAFGSAGSKCPFLTGLCAAWWAQGPCREPWSGHSAASSRGQLSGSALPGKGGFGPRRLRVLPSLPLFSPLSSEPDWTEGAVLAVGSHALEELGQSFACVYPGRTDASSTLPVVTNQVLGSFRALASPQSWVLGDISLFAFCPVVTCFHASPDGSSFLSVWWLERAL